MCGRDAHVCTAGLAWHSPKQVKTCCVHAAGHISQAVELTNFCSFSVHSRHEKITKCLQNLGFTEKSSPRSSDIGEIFSGVDGHGKS